MNNPVLGAKLKKYPLGNIYQLFGENPEAYKQHLGLNGHNGIDITAIEGTPILGCAGKVVDIKEDVSGYGKHIRILTNPENGDYLEVTYGHLRDILVKIGDTIFKGQAIGTMGNTGFVISGGISYYWGNAPAGRGVHLHFGIRECSVNPTGWQSIYNGEAHFIKNYDNGFKGAVDPMKYLKVEDYAEIKNQYWFRIFLEKFLLAFKK